MTMLLPAKVSSVPFVNISDSIDFIIDVDSPVFAAEKDLLTYQEFTPADDTAGYSYLNERIKPEVQTIGYRLADYSKTILDVHQSKNRILIGPLELKQGLALTDNNRIEVHREANGQVVEFGDVNIENGTYAIKLTGLEGHLCARLRGSRHEILGQGCFSLESVKRQKKSDSRGPLISLSKYEEVLAKTSEVTQPASEIKTPMGFETMSSHQLVAANERTNVNPTRSRPAVIDYFDLASPDPSPLPDVSVSNSVGGHEDTYSSLVTTLSSPGYVPTRIVSNIKRARHGAFMQQNDTHVAAHNIAREMGYATGGAFSMGTIWGQARKDGKPLAGVDVVIEGHEDIKPLYLNEFYIPDPNQKVTATHGLYTFMGIPDGEYALRAQQGPHFVGFQNASVRRGAIALADIESTFRRKSALVLVYDLLNRTSQGAVVTLQNYEEDLVIEDGREEVFVQDSEDMAFAIVNPLDRNYLTTQYALHPDQNQFNFPLISKTWMEGLLAEARLSSAVQSRIVLGIGGDSPFRVEAIGSKDTKIIYFDSRGQVIEGNYGAAGGGFLILDPGSDIVEYAVSTAGKKEAQVHYTPTQPGVVSVIQVVQ